MSKLKIFLIAALLAILPVAAHAQSTTTTSLTGCLDCGLPDGAYFNHAVTFNAFPQGVSGGTLLQTSLSQGANGLTAANRPLLDVKNSDGSALAASAASGKFGASISLGTSQYLVSEAANSNTKTDDAIFEYTLPSTYVAGKNLTVTINASVAGSGTLTTKTLQVKAYKNATDGTQAATIGDSAKVITLAGADVASTITGTTLNPGDKVTIEVETVLTETAASNMIAHINSLRIN